MEDRFSLLNNQNPLQTAPLYFSASFFRISAILGGSTGFWALKNGATKRLVMRRFALMGWWDQATAVAGIVWQIHRFTGAAASGGTALTPIKARLADPASTVADLRVCTGAASLTAPGAVEASYLNNYFLFHSVAPPPVFEALDGGFVLEPSEGLVLFAGGNTATGYNLSINAAWQEI